jgi:diguanylate cyclase (GGDEF)-like protein
MHSVIALPLRGRRGTHGVIEIFNPSSEQLSDYTVAFLHILADYAAIAIENARDVAHIQQLTITDDTTGLYNVRHLYKVLGEELERSSRTHHPISLVFLDLDRFKRVNDIHGHLVGSELLVRTGRRLRELSPRQNLCFRYGGDEFVILMPNTDAKTALNNTRALNQALKETTFVMKNDLELHVSASMGVATAPADGTSVHTIIGAADTRMYEVKTSGRGAVRGA